MRITPGAPRVEVSTTHRKITAHAGAVLVRATAEAIGLGPAIDANLRLKARDRGLSEAESILGMAEALAAGAKCLDDLEVARADWVQEELRAMCEAAWAASHTKDTYLSAQFKRFARHFGKRGSNKAIVALAHTMIVIVWHVLSGQVDYVDLGPDYFQRLEDPDAQKRRLIRQLEALGLQVTIQPAA